MGESERYIDRKVRRITLGDDNNALMALVAINAMLFVCFGLAQVIYQISGSGVGAFRQEILKWVILPARLNTLATEPWSVLTFMFIHEGVILTLVNMLWLWAFGSILQNLAGNKIIIPLYLYGGLAAALFFIVSSYSLPVLHNQLDLLSLSGANASVLAIAIAATVLAPKYKIFPMINGGIPLWVITMIYLVISFVSASGDISNLFSYTGGALCGYLFMYSYQRGHNWGLWMIELYQWFITLFEPGRSAAEKNPRKALFYKTGDRKPFVRHEAVTQEKIDLILDKINQEGYSKLTDEEKSILRKASEEDF